MISTGSMSSTGGMISTGSLSSTVSMSRTCSLSSISSLSSTDSLDILRYQYSYLTVLYSYNPVLFRLPVYHPSQGSKW